MKTKKIIKRLSQNIDYIGIDMDTNNSFKFLKTYFKARKHFPGTRIETFVSSSGFGYHIIIYLDEEISLLENFFWRNFFNDCPYRLRLSFTKLMLNEGNYDVYDLMFSEKNGSKVVKFDIEEVLSNYEKIVANILSNWGSEKMNENIDKLSKEVKEELPAKTKFVTLVGIKGNSNREKLLKVCKDINAKDPTFKYRINPSQFKKYDFVLAVFSGTKDHAHERGCWIINKVGIEGLNYWVKEYK